MYPPVILREINSEEILLLQRWAASPNADESKWASILLLLAEGKSAGDVCTALGVALGDVSSLVNRFNDEGLGSLISGKKTQGGLRPRFSEEEFNQILEMAETDPSEWGLPFKRWTPQKLADAAVEKGIVRSISHVTVRNILKKKESGEEGCVAIAAVEPNGKHTSYFDRGMTEFVLSNYERAVECFYDSLRSKTATSEEEAISRAYLSEALEELSRYDEAHEVIRMYEEPHLLASLSPKIKARVRLRIGWICVWLQQYPKAIACFNDALRLFSEFCDDFGVSEANYAIGHTYAGINEFGIARDYLLDAVKAQKSILDRRLLAKIYDRLGAIAYYEGSLSDSKENYLKALEFASGSQDVSLLGTVLLDLGTTCVALGELAKAREYLSLAITKLDKGGRKDHLALTYNNLGDVLRREGKWDDALEMLYSSLDIALEHTKRLHEGTVRISLGEILCARGQYSGAEEHLAKSLLLVDTDKWLKSGALRALAGVYFNQGNNDEAIQSLRQAVSLSTSIGDLQGVALAQVSLAEFHFLEGRNDQARECIELAQVRLKDEESLPMSGFVQRITGQLEAVEGRLVEARQHIAQSISIFTTVTYTYEMARSRYEMGLILKEVGDLVAAESNLRQALDIFDRLGIGEYSTKCRSALFDNRHSNVISGGNAGSPSDVLLMQRLIDASATRDLLVRELAVVVFENFPCSSVLVFQLEGDGDIQMLASQGVSGDEFDQILRSVRISPDEAVIPVSGGYALRVAAIPVSTYIYLGANGSIDFARLQPFLKQAELCLEACTLRIAARRSAVSVSTHKVQTIMAGFIIGSPQMFDVIDRIHKIRTSDVTVLITGESGTGKELIARAIHAESARARSIFLPFNCTATPKDIIDSQLFGHRRGAFTGATANYPGIIRAAEGGTLFLDEIGDLSLDVQPKLMRFLQEGEIQPLGETRPIRVDVRILAATNIDLERAVEDGRFREDLFHRLNIIRIHIPPLRERREEIPVLAAHFLEHFVSRSGKRNIMLTEGAMDALNAFDWPGNVRQLRNEIERVVAYASDATSLVAEDFSPDIARPGVRRKPIGLSESGVNGNGRVPNNQNGQEVENGNRFMKLGGAVKLRDAVAELEKRLIDEALRRNRNNLTKTAQELGLSRRGLRLKLGQLGIEKGEMGRLD